MHTNFRVNELKSFLKKHQIVNTNALLWFYRKYDSTLSCSTLRWRIHELKKRQIIYSPKRGYYALKEKKLFYCHADAYMETLVETMQKSLPQSKFSIYSTKSLSGQADKKLNIHNVIIDVEASSLETAFFLFKEHYDNVFLKPNSTIYRHYIYPKKQYIILNTLHSDAPLHHVDSLYYTPKLEKLLVDLILNDPIILSVNKSTIRMIISNLQKHYHINYSTLNRYAKKRYSCDKLRSYGLLH